MMSTWVTGSSIEQAIDEEPAGAHASFDPTTRFDRNVPSTSATIGFSYQVHDEWYWLKSTSPVTPSYTRAKHSSA